MLHAALAWSLARGSRPSLVPMIWLNRAWGVACVVLAVRLATGPARWLLGGEAIVVVALSFWEARVHRHASAPRPRAGAQA